MRQVLILVFLSIVLVGCNNSKTKELSAFEIQKLANKHPGKKLMETHCYVCHSPSVSHDDRIGPPMIAIKRHYINEETTKENFIADMQAWIENPNEEDARMHGAVRRFGVMPKQAFQKETIEQISDYMFDFEIEQPEWFEDHFQKEKGKHKGQHMGKGKGKGKGKHQSQANNLDNLSFSERGLKYALSTKAVLGKNLMGTIQKKGTLEALNFCNERAYPLTDSMSTVYNAMIKRISDKPRNPKNLATTRELEYIQLFKDKLDKKSEIEPIVFEEGNKVHVYYPITTNSMCLQCHGKKQNDIKPDVVKRLSELYPEDKATGYGINQIRGIWDVSFTK